MRKNYILKNWVTEKSIPCRTCKVEIGPSEAAQRTPRTLSRHTEPGRKTHFLLSQFNKLSLKLLVCHLSNQISLADQPSYLKVRVIQSQTINKVVTVQASFI